MGSESIEMGNFENYKNASNLEAARERLEYEPTEEDVRRLNQVVDILSLLQQAEVNIALAGGYGLDALMQKLTRAHHDLDLLAANREHLRKAAEVLKGNGYLQQDFPEKVVLWLQGDEEFAVEIGSLEVVNKYSNMTPDQFIPSETNGSLQGVPVKAMPIEAQAEAWRIQSQRIGGTYDAGKGQNRQDIYDVLANT